MDRIGLVTRGKTSSALPDLERLRRNWEQRAPLPEAGADRLGHVAKPQDPYEAGRALVARLDREIGLQFADHGSVLRPFVERVERGFRAMDEKANAKADPDEIQKAREAFMRATRDLEDLCEVFALVRR